MATTAAGQPRLARPRNKKVLDINVWEATLQRVRRAYDLFDTIVVSFSGGKDSTVALHAVLHVAEELGKGPVPVIFNDEEAIPWETVEYMHRVAQRPDVEMMWLCLPFQLRNACSRKHPYWWTWAPESKDSWVRPMPEGSYVIQELAGVTDVPVNQRPGFPEAAWRLVLPDKYGTVGMVMGIRAAESVTRYRHSTNRKVDNYLISSANRKENPLKHITKVYAIYDWSTQDVWTAPATFGWDYNRAYDAMEMAGVGHSQQRCSPAFGEEPIEGLWQYSICFPDVWDRMQERVPGVGAAVRYSRTELYGYGGTPDRPYGMSWGEWITHWLEKHNPEGARLAAENVKSFINYHYGMTPEPILPNTSHPDSGISWKVITKLAMRGDFKNRKTNGQVSNPEATRVAYDAELERIIDAGRLREDTRWQ